jgi:hypothetical protein
MSGLEQGVFDETQTGFLSVAYAEFALRDEFDTQAAQ